MSTYLTAAPSIRQAQVCKICGKLTRPFCIATILGKHRIQYFQCDDCQFIQTETPFWLREAYAKVIADIDTGLVQRNLSLAPITSAIISGFFAAGRKFLDYGGGYGLFVRLMRDRGFDFEWFDKYAANIFAPLWSFDGQEKGSYELLTAFEVFEHLVDPIVEIREMLTFSQNLLFSTVLIPETNPAPGQWWYYALNSGQHISFYSLRSLARLADRFGLNLHSNGSSLHMFTTAQISPMAFRLICHRKVAQLINIVGNRPSLQQHDFCIASKTVRQKQLP